MNHVLRPRSAYGYDVDAVSLENGLACPEETLAIQSAKDDADINVIVNRFGITGQLPQGLRAPTFEDFSEVFDFRSAVEQIAMAEDAFMQLPARVRARFANDPQEFVAFCSDPANLKEMGELGLLKPVAPAPGAPVVPPASGSGGNPQN